MLLEDYTKEQQKINSFPVKKQHLYIGNIVRNVNSGFFTDFNQRLIEDILSRQAISTQLTIYLKKKLLIKKIFQSITIKIILVEERSKSTSILMIFFREKNFADTKKLFLA